MTITTATAAAGAAPVRSGPVDSTCGGVPRGEMKL